MIYPVLLAGGNGTRLWPVSRKSYPKQFTRLTGEDSPFQQTLKRFDDPGFEAPIVLTSEECRFTALEQLDEAQINGARVMIEPEGRNTAPAILTAALSMADRPEAVLLISPSDHAIEDSTAFRATVMQAAEVASKGEIVLIGTSADQASRSASYLRVSGGCSDGVLDIDSVIHKPSRTKARQLRERGNVLAHSGLIVMRVDAAMAAFAEHAPEMVGPCRAALCLGREDLGFLRLDSDAFRNCDALSFETAILEQLSSCKALKPEFRWTKLSSWQALKRHLTGPTQGNAVAGNALSGNATAIDCSGSLLKSDNPDIALVGLGLDGIVAVATDDGVLVADAKRSDEIGKVIEVLNAREAPQAESFQRCHRPWGYYETLSLGRRFQVKRIMVKPGAKLSLQSHMHRAEHWVVVEGSALVTVGDSESLISENQSTYIPLGEVHRLENPGKLPLHLIEVQSGCYLGEDDIIRLEDIYDRDAVA